MTLFNTYISRVNSGDLLPDDAQKQVAKKLNDFCETFDVIHNQKRTFLGKKLKKTATKGLYVWGGVGRGKTMLMDMVVASIQHKKTRRVHFHAFMLEIHARLKSLRDTGTEADFLKTIAKSIGKETDLLCFDELHVNDIADAMILGPLFDALDAQGVTMVITSNYAPDDLYKNGLQRARFLPFIDHLKSRMQIVHLNSPHDYRLRALNDNGTWFAPLVDSTWNAMNTLFETLTDHTPTHAISLNIDGRDLPIQRAHQNGGLNIAWCDFKTLCVDARGAADYLALANAFDIIFIDNIRPLSEHNRNEARRFMTLIDTLYDMRRVVIIRAATAPQDTYSGTTHRFEYERTLSRLIEMQSSDWFSSNLQGKL